MSKLGYTWYPRDFASDPDVMLMTAAERGIYRDLIDLAYQTDNCIRYSIEALSRYTNGDIKDIKQVLKTKGVNMGEYWKIPSCDKRIAIIKKNQENGGKNKGKKDPKANPVNNPDVNPNTTQTVSETDRQREREIEILKGNIKSEVQKEVLELFGFSEIPTHINQQRLVKDFFYSKSESGELDYFVEQFIAYRQYLSIGDNSKFKFSLPNFLGDQKDRFENGKWASQNWKLKLSTNNPTRTVVH